MFANALIFHIGDCRECLVTWFAPTIISQRFIIRARAGGDTVMSLRFSGSMFRGACWTISMMLSFIILTMSSDVPSVSNPSMMTSLSTWGPFKCYVTQMGGKRYEDVMFNMVLALRGGGCGVQFPGKKRYVTLEWPLAIVSRRRRQVPSIAESDAMS